MKTIGPSKLTMARPISAPYSSWRLRIDSGEPSKPDRLASTTTGRLPLAALIGPRHLLATTAGRACRPCRCRGRRWAGSRDAAPSCDSMPMQAHRDAAEVGVLHDGRLGVGHAGPALERLVVLVGDGPHHGADVERLLAVGVGGEEKISPTVVKPESGSVVRVARDVTVRRVARRRRGAGRTRPGLT